MDSLAIVGVLGLRLPREQTRRPLVTGAGRVAYVRILLLRTKVVPAFVGDLDLHAMVLGSVGFATALIARLPFRLLLSSDLGKGDVGINASAVPVLARGFSLQLRAAKGFFIPFVLCVFIAFPDLLQHGRAATGGVCPVEGVRLPFAVVRVVLLGSVFIVGPRGLFAPVPVPLGMVDFGAG